MKTTKITAIAAALFALPLYASTTSIVDEPTTPREYADLGMRHADEYPGLVSLCNIDKPIRNAAEKKRQKGDKTQRQKSDRKRVTIEPTQVFDNLYFVGNGSTSSWVIETSDGLIVIDAMNNNNEAEKYIEAGLIELGLDPKDIKYLVITHSHGDHYGGQEYLVNKYQAKVVMSEIEWQRLEHPIQELTSPRWGKPPKRDVSVHDGEILKLGDTQVQAYVSPGHTPGTLSLLFPVYDKGVKHMVGLWGGTSINYGPQLDRIEAYSVAAKRMSKIATDNKVDIFLSNHSALDGTRSRFPQLKDRKENAPHPFVRGQEAVQQAYDLMYNCTKAQALRIKQEAEQLYMFSL